MKTLKIIAILLFLFISINFAQTSWNLDNSHSKLGFSVTHMLITEVDGKFNDFSGSITSNDDSFEGAKIEFSAKIASIDTDNEKRDQHLEGDDFFNAEKFPELKFVGKTLTKVEGKKYKLVGDLTMRGVIREVELDVVLNGIINDPWGNTRAGFKIEGEVNRFDYNLKWNKALEAGGLIVGEDVKIYAKLELVKQK